MTSPRGTSGPTGPLPPAAPTSPRELLDTLPTAVFTVDPEKRITFWNREAERLTGFSREEALGQDCSFFAVQPCRDHCALFGADGDSGEPVPRECTIRGSGGVERIVSKSAVLLRNDEGLVVGGMETFMEITGVVEAREGAREEARDTAQRLSLALEGASDGLWDWDLRTNEVYLSPRWKEMLGYSDDELPSSFESWERLVHPEDREAANAAIQAYLSGESEDYWTEVRMLHMDGSERLILSRGAAIRDEATGDFVRFVGTHVDLTELRRLEEELVQSRARLQGFVDVTSDLVTQVDAEGNFLFVNRAAERIYGISPEECVGRPAFDFIHPEDRASTMAAFGGWLQERVAHATFENRQVSVGGDVTHMFWSINPRYDDAGELVDVWSIARDMTRRKIEEERSRTFLDTSLDGFWVVDVETSRFLQVNPAYCLMSGYSESELLEMGIPDVEAVEDRDAIRNRLDILVDEGADRFETRHRKKDGSIMDVEVSARHLEMDGGRIFVFVRDITERKRAQEALREREERLSLVLGTSPVGWAEHELKFDDAGGPVDYRFLEVNSAFEAFTGLKGKDIVGRWVTDVIPGIESADPNLIQLYGDVVTTGEEAKMEVYFEPFDAWYAITAFSHRPGHFVTMFEEISFRKRAEEEMKGLNRRLQESNQELQQFAYVASHDLQEPLRMVASYTQLLEKRYGDQLEGDAREFMGYVVEGATRMQALINDLLEFSRLATRGATMEETDAEEALGKALDNLSGRISEEGAVVTHDPLPTVLADGPQLARLFQNLVGNAVKFRNEEAVRVHVGVERAGERWVFSVKDNGIGIEAGFHDRIFDIFQRLHARVRYEGTGIGLAICKRIVQRHGGRLWVESEPGQGSTFFFTLEAAE